MTDTERLDALESFALPGSVWILNPVRDKGVLSTVPVPVRAASGTYAEKFGVPHWNSLRDAIDGWKQGELNGRR